ncbi:hypothetical protein [Deferrisoma sp.]
MVRGVAQRWVILLALGLAAAARAGVPDDLACRPELRELDARLEEVEAELEATRSTLWELRGSYFYYPDPNLSEEDLTGTRQRADLYLRYPLWERLRALPSHRAALEAEVAALRAERDERIREMRRTARVAAARHRRAETLADRYRGLARDLEAEAARREDLWLDKVVLLEDVLEARRERDRALAEAARWEAEAREAREELRAASCGQTPEIPELGPVVFPDPACAPPPDPPASLLLRARAEREAPRPGSGARLDLEAGYTWEEDVDDGLQGGSRIGVRFVWPFGARRAPVGEPRARRWESRARGEAAREAQARVALWARVEALEAERRLAETEARLEAERRRTRALRGETGPPSSGDPLERAWDVYLRALELQARLFPDGPPACDRPPKAVFPVPAPPAVPRKRPPREAYVWGGPSALGDPEDVAAFCRAKGIKRLYVSPGGEPLDPFSPTWERIIGDLADRGVGVHLLLGENRWALPGEIARFRRRLADFEAFQLAAPRPFAGLHLDVEPQALDAWDDRPGELLEGLAAVVEAAREAVGALPGRPSLTASLPVWLHERAAAEITARIAAALDGVVVMAYGTPRSERVRAAAMAWAPAPAWPAINAREFSTEGDLEREIRRITALWPDAERVAVHDWQAWRRIAQVPAGE